MLLCFEAVLGLKINVRKSHFVSCRKGGQHVNFNREFGLSDGFSSVLLFWVIFVGSPLFVVGCMERVVYILRRKSILFILDLCFESFVFLAERIFHGYDSLFLELHNGVQLFCFRIFLFGCVVVVVHGGRGPGSASSFDALLLNYILVEKKKRYNMGRRIE